MGAALALSLQFGMGWRPPPAGVTTGNPLVTTYTTKDDRFLSFSCLQAAKYWPELCEIVGRPELATDARFADADAIRENAGVATDLLRAVFAERTSDAWREQLSGFSGQWVLVQDTLEAVSDPQTVANGYVAECETAEGAAYQLATAPVQYDGEPARPARAPEFNEHGDAILADLGIDWDTIIDLKVKGVVPGLCSTRIRTRASAPPWSVGPPAWAPRSPRSSRTPVPRSSSSTVPT
jgi:crotonobetainyl-CoA:carnitine CoA-transferase CaiB-like acyl-CoA transferase